MPEAVITGAFLVVCAILLFSFHLLHVRFTDKSKSVASRLTAALLFIALTAGLAWFVTSFAPHLNYASRRPAAVTQP